MAVNLKLGVDSGNNRRVGKRRSTLRFEEPQFQPQFEWLQIPEAHILRAELPGFKKENLSAHIDLYRNLTVRGKRPTEESELVEKHRQQFRRIFNVPENVDTSSITAKFDKEILYIIVPKVNSTSPITFIQITDDDNRKNDNSGSNVEDQGIKSDKTPLDDFAESSVLKTNEPQLEIKKSGELANETTTGSGISTESVKTEQGKAEVVKASGLSTEKEMVENPLDQTKIDPCFPAAESLPPPSEKEKEKSEGEIQEVKEKEYSSGAVDENPKLETHEIKEEKLNYAGNGSGITQAGIGTPDLCISLLKMPSNSVLVVSAIVVLSLGLFIACRLM